MVWLISAGDKFLRICLFGLAKCMYFHKHFISNLDSQFYFALLALLTILLNFSKDICERLQIGDDLWNEGYLFNKGTNISLYVVWRT